MSSIVLSPGLAPARRVQRSAPAPMRLTRRGRLVLLTLLVAVVFAALMMLGDQSAATGEAGTPVETRLVQVGEGDTLWVIASEVAGSGDVRQMMHQIEQLNALPSAGLVVGQELAIPVAD